MVDYRKAAEFWFALACAVALLTLTLPAHATVEWDFTPTAIVDCSAPCALTGRPVASLILDGPDSSGTAFFNMYDPPTLTGDPFTFALADGIFTAREHISTAEPTGLGCEFCAGGYGSSPLVPWAIVDYSLSWRETAGALDAVLITFNTEQDGVTRLTLTGGTLATDLILGGCAGVCDVTGVWSDAPSPAPEPGTLVLFAGALAAFGLRRRPNAPQS
jgi:hypothetical protein